MRLLCRLAVVDHIAGMQVVVVYLGSRSALRSAHMRTTLLLCPTLAER